MRVTRRVLRATLNYKTDKFIPWDTGQTSGIPRLINEPLIPTFYLIPTPIRSPRPPLSPLKSRPSFIPPRLPSPRTSTVYLASYALTPRWTRVIEFRNLDDRVIRSLASADLTIITFTLPARIRRHDIVHVKGYLPRDRMRKRSRILSTANQIFISNLHVRGNNLFNVVSTRLLREYFIRKRLAQRKRPMIYFIPRSLIL